MKTRKTNKGKTNVVKKMRKRKMPSVDRYWLVAVRGAKGSIGIFKFDAENEKGANAFMDDVRKIGGECIKGFYNEVQ